MKISPSAERKLYDATRNILEAMLEIQADEPESHAQEEWDDLTERLAKVIENNTALRRQLKATQEVLDTRNREIKGLRQRNLQLERTTDDLRKALTRPAATDNLAELDRMMRTRPVARD